MCEHPPTHTQLGYTDVQCHYQAVCLWFADMFFCTNMQGAAQFAADCEAVMALLQPYTPRPTAHFRELCDAARLLTLQQDRVRSTDFSCS